jgi:hypothetical protein
VKGQPEPAAEVSPADPLQYPYQTGSDLAWSRRSAAAHGLHAAKQGKREEENSPARMFGSNLRAGACNRRTLLRFIETK